jgi:ribose 5-phosphate isomerase A
MTADLEDEKRAAGIAAAQLVQPGQAVGLGTGSTVAHFLPALAARELRGLRCVATSVATETQARELGLPVEPFGSLARLDIAVDGTDQVTPDGWLVKGGGGAHVREKIVAAAAARFVVIAGSDKPVEHLAPPVPVELLAFGLAATLHALGEGTTTPRAGFPASPDGGVIADYDGPLEDPAAVAAALDAVPGVVGHGLFPPAMVHDVLIACGGRVEHRHLR